MKNKLTPKQKAAKLYNTYWNYFVISHATGIAVLSKECAKLCVNEMLKNIPSENNTKKQTMKRMYYMEVRAELNKL